MVDAPTQTRQRGLRASRQSWRGPGADWLLLVMLVGAMAIIAATGEGWLCLAAGWSLPAAGIGLVVFLVLRRRSAELATIAGPLAAGLVALAIGLFLVMSRPAKVFEKVFMTPPPETVTLLEVQQPIVVRDPSALVVVQAEPDVLQGLLEAADFERDTEAERRLADPRRSDRALASLAVGTRFLDDLDPSAPVEIYHRGDPEGPERTLYRVVYDPTSGRAYAFWLRF